MAFLQLTIQSGQVQGSQSDMPLLVVPSAVPGFGAISQAEARSIRVYADEQTNTELPRQVVSSDEIHVKVGSVSDGATIYIDYDGVRSDYAVDDTYGQYNTWPDKYKFVSHDGGFTESTRLASDRNINGSVSRVNGGGKFGDATKYSGADADYIKYGAQSFYPNGTDDRTFSLWAKPNGEGDSLITQGEANSGGEAMGVRFWGQDRLRIWEHFGATTESYDATASRYYYVSFRRNNNDGDLRIDNDIDVVTHQFSRGTRTSDIILSSRIVNGSAQGGSPTDIGEIRLVNQYESDDWVSTEYNNQNDNSAFWAANEIQTNLETWDLTIDTTRGNGNPDFLLHLFRVSEITIAWGDGASDTYTTDGDKSHTYASPGEYTVSISGSFTGAADGGVNQPFDSTRLSNYHPKITATDVVKGISNITSFLNTFRNTSLTSIPDGLFDNTPNVTNFGNTFQDTSITSIPSGLFDNTPNVTDFTNIFRNTSLTSIPDGLFDNTPNVTNFGVAFFNTSLTSIPDGLFDNTPNVTGLDSTFRNTSITSIPSGLFDNTPDITSLFSTFQDTPITSIPSDLFDNTPNVTNLSRTFQNTSLSGYNAYNLWLRYASISGRSNSFSDSNADNVQYIPSDWGGGGQTAPGNNPTVTTDTRSGNTVTGTVTDAGGTDITWRGVVWSEERDPTIEASQKQFINSDLNQSTGQFSVDLENIDPNKTYYYRTFAANSGGVSYGESSAVGNPTLDVKTNDASAVTENSASFNGTVLEDYDTTVTERGFEYTNTQNTYVESFESDFGNWQNVDSVTGWRRQSNGTTSSNTGPSSAFDGSFYIYVETSSGNSFNNGDQDIIETEAGIGNISFAFHQYGADQGTLYLEGFDVNTWVELWSSTGDQGNQWNQVSGIDVTPYSRVRFRNVAAGSFRGDIALDNISIPQIDTSALESVTETGSFSEGPFTLNETGLASNTTYYYRAIAANNNDTTRGRFVSFTTLATEGTALYELTMNATQVSGTHANMPVLIQPEQIDDFPTLSQAEAESVRVYADENRTTELAREIVSSNEIYVKASVAGGNTIYVDYDGARADYAVTDTYGRNNVWTNGYLAVLHLGENQNNTAPQFIDSTGNGHDAESNGDTPQTEAKLGNGITIGASNGNYIRMNSPVSVVAGSDFTYSQWFNGTSLTTGTNPGFWRSGSGSDGNYFNILNGNSRRPWIRWAENDVLLAGSGYQIPLNTEVHISYEVDSATRAAFTANGQERQTANHTAATGAFEIYNVGYQFDTGERVHGVYDEMRFQDTVRSTSWKTTEYNNQNDNNAFWNAAQIQNNEPPVKVNSLFLLSRL